jgi:hypothetical protein
MKKEMIKRKDGSYSQRGLWDNIRANRGSGKKPTAEMLNQEKKIKSNMANGGVNNPGFRALPSYVQAKIRSNMQMGGMSGSPVVDMINQSAQPAMMQVGGMMPQSSAGQSVLQEAMTMSTMQSGGEYNRMFNRTNRKDAPIVLNPKNKNQFYLNKQMDTDLSYRLHQQMLNQDLGKPYIDELGNEVGNTRSEMDSRVEEAYRISNLRNSLNEKKKMQSGGKMPADIARARFMAAAKGNVGQAKETASRYGYKMQNGAVRFNPVQMDSSKPGFNFAQASAASVRQQPTPVKAAPKYIPPTVDNRSYGDNTRVQSNVVDRKTIAKNQAMIAKSKTAAGQAELRATKARVTESMAKQAEAKIEAEKQRQIKSSNADIMGGLGDDAKISDYVGAFNKSDARASELDAMYNLDKTQTGSRIRTGYDTDTYDASKLTKEQVDANYANSGNRLGLFSTRSPLVTAGLASPTSKSFVDSYMNPLVYAETMAASGMRGVEEAQSTDGNIGDAMKGLGAAGISFGLGKGIGSKLHGLEHGLTGATSKAIRNKAMPMLLNAESNAAQQAISGTARGLQVGSNQAIKQGIGAGEHAIVHNVSPMYGTPAYTPPPTTAFGNGGLKEMYYMKNGGQFPERYKKMGFSGVDKPKRTTSGGKSHAVVTKVDGNYKLIRFGQKGVSGSPDGSARNKAFKARHAKNIAKGKSSAAYWANKVKW